MRSPLVLLWFDSFCTSAVNIPGIVLTRQHPFQHPQHYELDLLGWVSGGFRLARVGSWWVPGLFRASLGVAALYVLGWFSAGLWWASWGWFRGLGLV